MEALSPHVEELAQVRRITEHHLFRGSESLCRLLRFLVEHAVNRESEPLRESDIATRVFRRRADFDPQSDSIVRVQIGRLRSRLTQYYFEAGVSDPVVLEIPRGGYSLSISYRERPQARNEFPIPPVHAPTPDPALHVPKQRRNVAIAVLVTAIALAAVYGGVIAFSKPRIAAPLATFWKPFISIPLPPLVIYSHQVRGSLADFSRPEFSASPPRPLYTGVGEVMGAVSLTHLFDKIGHDINFRGESVTPWEDVKHSNLIFVGTATQSLKAVGYPERFVLRHRIPEDQGSPLVIVDLKPEPGHPAIFGHSTDCCQPADEDYALLMLSPALTPERVALTMFGTSTLGTQAAVEFVCDPDLTASLLRYMPGEPRQRMPFFEAVLRVRIRDNAPIASEVAAFHLRGQR